MLASGIKQIWIVLWSVVNVKLDLRGVYVRYYFGLDARKLSSGFANNKGADQPARPRNLISAFVIRLLESIISKLATSKISIF